VQQDPTYSSTWSIDSSVTMIIRSSSQCPRKSNLLHTLLHISANVCNGPDLGLYVFVAPVAHVARTYVDASLEPNVAVLGFRPGVLDAAVPDPRLVEGCHLVPTQDRVTYSDPFRLDAVRPKQSRQDPWG
jgi:hypothetical protein